MKCIWREHSSWPLSTVNTFIWWIFTIWSSRVSLVHAAAPSYCVVQIFASTLEWIATFISYSVFKLCTKSSWLSKAGTKNAYQPLRLGTVSYLLQFPPGGVNGLYHTSLQRFFLLFATKHLFINSHWVVSISPSSFQNLLLLRGRWDKNIIATVIGNVSLVRFHLVKKL